MEWTQKDVDFVKKFGTAVKSGTERYVLELKGLEKPMDFENPKDAGTEWGAQHLKGDGKDILLLNGVSAEQVKKLDGYLKAYEMLKKRPAEQMDAADVKNLMGFLEKNDFNDRYCSDQAYKKQALIPTQGRMCRRNNDECRATVVPVGATYSDGVKTQRANVEGALFVVDSKGNGRITNVPTDYQTIQPKDKIKTYAEAVRQSQMLRSAHTRG